MLETAIEYLQSGLCVLPAVRVEKRPAVSRWKHHQKELPTETHLRTWFAQRQDGVCIICGKVSGNLEMLDFDGSGVLFEPWKELIDDALLARLVIERSPSGGLHVVYRCESEVNSKLTSQRVEDQKRAIAAQESWRKELAKSYKVEQEKPDSTFQEVRGRLDGVGRTINEISSAGTFNAAAAFGLGAGSAMDRTAKATEKTAENTEKIMRKVNTFAWMLL